MKHYFIRVERALLFLQRLKNSVMQVHTGFEYLKPVHPVVTTGVFDGVHSGHRALLDSLVRTAKQRQGESVVVTFDPPPRLVLSRDKNEIFFLSTPDEKRKIIEETGIDHLLILKFTETLRDMSAHEFIAEILVGKIGTEHLIVGYDHHFGKKRSGDFDSIKKYAAESGFTVQKIGEVFLGTDKISSTTIRRALLEGNPGKAEKMLGYPYSLGGIVIKGKGIGRSLGFPTANLKPSYRYKLIPADGVYAVTIDIEGVPLKGILSIGYNPTVNRDNSERSVEVNIFDFEYDIYGREIRVFFRHWLRPEKRFDNIKDLTDQMKKDKQVAMNLLSKF